MKIIVKGGIIIAALIIQLTIINSFTIQGLKPDLVLVVVIVIALLQGAEEGIIYGFVSGLLQDIFSIGLLGVNALVKTVMGFICGILREKLFAEHLLLIVPLVTLFISIVQNILMFYILRAFGMEYNLAWSLRKVAIIEAFYNSLLSPFVFIGVKKLLLLIKI